MLNIFGVIILCGICNAKSVKSLVPLYENEKIVTDLTAKSFEKLVINGSPYKIWFILFYSPLNLSSRTLVPEFVKAAYSMRHEVNFGLVNLHKYKSLRDIYGEPGAPFIKIFGKDRTQPWNYRGRWKAKDIIRASWTAEFNNCYETT